MPDALTLDISGLTPEHVAELLTHVRSMREEQVPSTESFADTSWVNAVSTGWTLNLVFLVRENLRRRGNDVQLEAFNQAISNGGLISRDEIFRIGGYEPDRQLKNWTKPLRTITADLIERDSLPKDAEFPMEAAYTEGTGYRQAHAFRVAPEIVRLVKEAMCDDCFKLVGIGPKGRVIPPHESLSRVGEFRQLGNAGANADEQDYLCEACSKEWMHETGNAGMGWVETSD